MELPYYVFALIYALGFIVYSVLVFGTVYHMIRFGFFDFMGKLHTIILLVMIGLNVFFTILLLSTVEWSGGFSLFDTSLDYFFEL